MPPANLPDFDRRAGTPLTERWSEKVAICVSVAPWTSMADGGAIEERFFMEDAKNGKVD